MPESAARPKLRSYIALREGQRMSILGMSRAPVAILAAASSVVIVAGIAAIVSASTGSSQTASDNTVASATAAPTADEHQSTVRCADLPHLWSGAGDIGYDPQSGIVHFAWPDGTAADVRDSEPGCAAQPGLEGQLDGYREGALASERASCRDLQYLVDAIRAERRSNGQSTSGRVPVSDAAQAAAARRAGASPEGAVAKRHVGSGLIDLDQADTVLGQCPR
jgi:hypothetical protein